MNHILWSLIASLPILIWTLTCKNECFTAPVYHIMESKYEHIDTNEVAEQQQHLSEGSSQCFETLQKII